MTVYHLIKTLRRRFSAHATIVVLMNLGFSRIPAVGYKSMLVQE